MMTRSERWEFFSHRKNLDLEKGNESVGLMSLSEGSITFLNLSFLAFICIF